MNNLDTRLKETLDRVAQTTNAKRRVDEIVHVHRRRRPPRFTVAVAAFAAVAAVFALPMMIGNSPTNDVTVGPEETEPATSPTVNTTTTAPVEHEVPSFSVKEIDRTFTPDDGTWNDQASADVVADVLASTREEFDELPDEFVPDAAALNGRVVVVGGNSEQTARIWYSDGGPWIEAEIRLPSGLQIGDEPGQHRLADGIGNLDVIGGQFVAWETAQPVITAEDFDFPETILLTSPDGSDWTARTVDGSFRALIPWEGGALAVATHEWEYSNVLWSADFEDWVEIAELGPVYVEAIDVEDASIDLAVKDYSMNVSNETGETYHTDDGASRTIRLSSTG